MTKKEKFISILEDRVLLLDGAMGTMIQQYCLTEKDFRGERFKAHQVNLSGFNDILNITSPQHILSIHKAYLEAGADIITTDTFNANAISMADYALHQIPGLIGEINREAAMLARRACEETGLSDAGSAFVAGSIGPTNRTASMSPDVNDPAKRNVTYDELYAAYSEQIEGLVDGGVDILLFETVFDTLNLKAGLDAANHVMKSREIQLPIMISVTISDKSGRTLSGQTLEAFTASIEDYDNVVSIGLNCGFGPQDMLPRLRELGELTAHYVSAHPNAGLPDAMGEYKETPEVFAAHVGRMVKEKLLNIAGGCCGTTPAHIACLRQKIDNESNTENNAGEGHLIRKPKALRPALRISGLDRVEVLSENNFVNVGERCNVAGSRKFLRLIKEKKYEEAMGIALHQVEAGAMLIDINMDDAMLDAREEMVHFLRYISSDPEIARVPVMLDSSRWEVVEDALKNLQGKSIVNSISLKEGEELFISKARRIRELGAAVIVMAFDEEGQADTFERKIEICRRAYDILIGKCGFKRDDIIFDVNVMAIATGIEEHNLYARDFIRAVEWVKKNLPGARTSGGISNLSFAFRGKNTLREAMHAVFLYHAIRNGLDMGIVNPATTVTYEDIPSQLRNLLEDVILASRCEAAEELAAYAANESPESAGVKNVETHRDLNMPVAERLFNAIVKGNSEYLKEDLEEALGIYGVPVNIIEGPLMEGMNRVGELFGEGKMFLPQVVKTARTMKMAVDILKPYMPAATQTSDGKRAGKVVFATVKGDVHDIGKNIVSIVMACNNYEVIDLGVMVPAEKIVATVIAEEPDLLFLSGLITPSLSEMVNVVKMLEERGVNVPVLVGGATTSAMHTAIRIAPVYSGVVVHAVDASQNPLISARLLSRGGKDDFIKSVKENEKRLREDYEMSRRGLDTFGIANSEHKIFYGPASEDDNCIIKPEMALNTPVIVDFDLKEVTELINWKMFFHSWKLEGDFLKGFPYDGCPACAAVWLGNQDGYIKEKAEEALKIYKDARAMLNEIISSGNYDGRGCVAVYPARSEGNDLHVGDVIIPALRQQGRDTEHLCIADFVAPAEDYVGVFAVTAGKKLEALSLDYKIAGDDYKALLCSVLSDRIAEASSELLHYKVRKALWGYNPEEMFEPARILRGEYPGIRPAMGYPMLPDQLLNLELGKLIPLSELGLEFTENGAMNPSSSVSGLYIANPRAHYFMVGEIGEDQVRDYARRRGLPPERIREILR